MGQEPRVASVDMHLVVGVFAGAVYDVFEVEYVVLFEPLRTVGFLIVEPFAAARS